MVERRIRRAFKLKKSVRMACVGCESEGRALRGESWCTSCDTKVSCLLSAFEIWETSEPSEAHGQCLHGKLAYDEKREKCEGRTIQINVVFEVRYYEKSWHLDVTSSTEEVWNVLRSEKPLQVNCPEICYVNSIEFQKMDEPSCKSCCKGITHEAGNYGEGPVVKMLKW